MQQPDTDPVIERAIALGGGTQAALAERSGLSQQYISKLLAKQKRCSIDAAIKISRATDGQLRISEIMPEVVDAVARELGVETQDRSAAA